MKKFGFIVTFICLTCLSVQAQNSSVFGVVENDVQQPIFGIRVVVETADGLIHEDYTDSLGQFKFLDLEAGEFTLYTDTPGALRVLEPACAYHSGYLDGSNAFSGDFTLEGASGFKRNNGVAVDFGKPTQGGSPPPTSNKQANEDLQLVGETFDFSIFMTGAGSLAGTPTKLIVEGSFYAPGLGVVNTESIDGWAGASTTLLTVDIVAANQNAYAVLLETEALSGLDVDGEIATFRFRLPVYAADYLKNNLGTLLFCVTSVQLRDESSTVLYEATDHWVGRIQ